jgi:carboxyl-terminal processing protease
MKRRISLLSLMAGLLVLAFFTGGWLKRPEPAANNNVYQQARLFETVLSAIRRSYVDSISEPDLYFRATTGIVDHLHDPYSALLVDGAYRKYENDLSGSYVGLGLQLDLRAGAVVVAAVDPDSPAEHDGILPGDRIMSIDGRPTKGLNVGQASEALQGEPGTEVTLVIRRVGEPDATHRLARRMVHVRAASPGILLPDSIGVVTLSRITATSARELRESIDSLRREGMKALVLDLRYNPGGVLSQGVAVADLFLDRGELVATLRGRNPGDVTAFRAEQDQAWPGLPLAVVVNGGTASSAEIIAAALQDHDRAVVVGTQSYGKGAVQSTIPLGDGLALKLTTARWYAPSGRTVQRPGQFPRDGAAAPADTTESLRFYSDSGRPLDNAAGIIPDLRATPQQLTAGEAAFRHELGGELSRYYDLLTAFAQELRESETPPDSNFQVTAQLRADFRMRMEREGLTVPRSVFEGARSMIDRDLEEAIAQELFGPTVAARRAVVHDRQIQAAVRALADSALAVTP